MIDEDGRNNRYARGSIKVMRREARTPIQLALGTKMV